MPKKPPPEYGNALNATKNLTQQIVTGLDLFDGEGDPRIGVLALHTPAGHYQFMLSEPVANELIQTLRDFIAGDVDRLP
jgi:hypothetical protein